MLSKSKLVFWVAGLSGLALWTAAIIAVTNLPLMVQLALGGMGLVACFWGQAVCFPHERAVIAPSSPGRMARDEILRSMKAVTLPVGTARVPVTRRSRAATPATEVADNPPLLRHPFEEAARMEARRLAEAITAAGVFGAVTVRIEGDGTATISPVQENDGIRVPITTVIRFATYAVQSDGLVSEGAHGAGTWPGRDLQAAMDAHIAAYAPAAAPAQPAHRGPAPAAGQAPAWADPMRGAARTA